MRRWFAIALVLLGSPVSPFASAPAAGASSLPPSPGSPAASFDVGSLHVDRYGTGSDAVVLIPGLSCGPWVWYGVIAHLATSRRVYVVTLPGFDGRPPATTPPGGLFATTEGDLARLIAREHLARPVVVGHSLGGSLAIGFAEAYPLAARAVVSVDALPVVLALAYLPPGERKTQADSAAAAFGAMSAPRDQRQLQLQNIATTGAVDPEEMEQIFAAEGRSDHATATQDLRELLETDLRPALGRIVVPLLIVVPYYAPDNRTPPGITPVMSTSIAQKTATYRGVVPGTPSARFVPIEPARHFVMLDAPGAFDRALDAFLDANPPHASERSPALR